MFTAQGDLAGLVSSLVYDSNGNATFQNDEGKTLLTLQNASNYFLFTGFNGSVLNFIRIHVPGLRTIGAENGFIEPTQKKFDEIVQSINGSMLVM